MEVDYRGYNVVGGRGNGVRDKWRDWCISAWSEGCGDGVLVSLVAGVPLELGAVSSEKEVVGLLTLVSGARVVCSPRANKRRRLNEGG